MDAQGGVVYGGVHSIMHAGHLRFLGVLASIALLGMASVAAAPADQGVILRKLADYPLPGDTSRYDYQSFDPTSHRLYIAHLGMGVLRVFDTQANALVGTVEGVPGVHGVVAVPELGRVFATATGAQAVAVIDPVSLSVVATMPGGEYPDGLAYATNAGKLYVSDEFGAADVVIDPNTNSVVATIPLGGEAGNTQYDPASGQVFVAVQTLDQLTAIDPLTDTVVATYDMPGCDHPHGLAIDAERRLAFVACQRNARLVVLDMETMQVTASHSVGRNPDVVALEPQRGVVYVAAEDGVLTAFMEDSFNRGQLKLFTQQNAGPNAHSVAVDTDSRHIFLPTLDIRGAPVLREFGITQALEDVD